MPTSSSAATVDKKKLHASQIKLSASNQTRTSDSKEKDFLTIGPALPPKSLKQSKPSHNLSISKSKNDDITKSAEVLTVQVRQNGPHLLRAQKEKEKHPDRICLDRRGLTVIPVLDDEPKLRLLSLQHNLINTLEGFKEQSFQFLVFLDIYDNQLEKISYLEKMENLRVLLLGKNRIKKIEGLHNLPKVEVLDLHGNQIQTVTGLSSLPELKVLNLAGNQLKIIGVHDLHGLNALQELNLRRNKIRKLLGFGNTPNLLKLFLSNNDLQNVEDMSSIAKATNVKEISIDNNPVFLNGDCVSFLVSFLSRLTSLNSMQITEQVRKAAMAWRRNKESTNASFLDLSRDASLNGRREEVISNARTNWELLRSQTKCLKAVSNCAIPKVRKLEPDVDFILTSLAKPENPNVSKVKLKSSAATTKVPALTEKKLTMRTTSQDTDNSQNTSSSNSSNEFFRLPPILVPIINKMENQSDNTEIKAISKSGVKPAGSLTSIGPNVDSSVSSLNSTHSDSSSESSNSESDSDDSESNSGNEVHVDAGKNQDEANQDKDLQLESKINMETNTNTSSTNTSDSASNISTNTAISNITIPSTSTDLNSKSSSNKSTRSIKSAVNSRMVHTRINSRAATAKPKKSTSPIQTISKDREQGGDYLIEICGRHLNIYGQGALRFIDKPWNSNKANDVTTIHFNYANFNGISSILGKIKLRFPNAENFVFKETNILYIGQLNALAEIQGLVSLTIESDGNPLTQKPWKHYAIYRLSHWGLKTINGEIVQEEEIAEANAEYQSLSDLVLWSLPEPLLQPLLTRLHIDLNHTGKEQSAKKWLLTADPALRSVVSKEALQWKKGIVSQEDLISRQKAKFYCSSIIDQTCSAIKKLRLLDQQWPTILHDIVQNTLIDYSQIDTYMKRKIKELT